MGERAREASKKQLPNGISLFFGDGKLQNNKKNGNRKITHDTRHDNLQLNSAGNWLQNIYIYILKYIYIYVFWEKSRDKYGQGQGRRSQVKKTRPEL